MPTYHSISWNWQKWHLHLKILWGLKSTCWTGVRTQRSWRHLTRDQAENHQSRSSNFSLVPRPPRPSKVKTREHPQTFIDVLITRKDWATFSWFAYTRRVGVISLFFVVVVDENQFVGVTVTFFSPSSIVEIDVTTSPSRPLLCER